MKLIEGLASHMALLVGTYPSILRRIRRRSEYVDATLGFGTSKGEDHDRTNVDPLEPEMKVIGLPVSTCKVLTHKGSPDVPSLDGA